MATNNPSPQDALRAVEWSEFTSLLPRHRDAVERMLLGVLSYDARRDDNLDAHRLASEMIDAAVVFMDEKRVQQPAGATPSLWLRKVALTLLDERLDQAAMAGGGLYHSWTGVRGALLALGVNGNDAEQHRWLQVHARAKLEASGGDPNTPPTTGRILSDKDKLLELERAVLRQPEYRRRFLMHHYFDQLSHDEIAFLMDATLEEVDEELTTARRGFWLELSPRG